ncbi:hypothetical protein MJO29_014958 [Puccinia striiformis f. sp. tritici]|nr:hypothetical protein MJO29_014958 [Puccinia striiformis f. sp. tritici]
MLNLALLHAQSCSPPSSLCLPHLSTLQRLTPSPSLLCNILPCGPPHCNCAINDHKSSKRDESKQDPSITQSLPQAPWGCLVALNSALIFSEMRAGIFVIGGSFQGPKSSLARKLTELLMPHLIDRMQDLISTPGGIRQFEGRFDLFGDEDDNFCDKMVAFKVRSRPSLARNS